ncbi:MAG: flagellar protein export ATPase FliI [Alphaproteobacteria bacterium]|nr:flagellar protein export ATPase FliI [Alphaproteobacteria bacterium]
MRLRQRPVVMRRGSVSRVRGGLVEIAGLGEAATVGARLELPGGALAEVAGVEDGQALCLSYGPVEGLAPGASAHLLSDRAAIAPDASWLGRIVDGLGRPIDGRGPLGLGQTERHVRGGPPPATSRGRVGAKLATGVRALDIFAPLCRGQRLGLFAGSGVGKSVLLSMLARGADCDVAVIGLIGERGREVAEFIEDDLGPEGLARAVVVVATSDEPALMRREAAYLTFAIAEAFRDEGRHVLCMMDSVTRFAMAQREIGLAAGEPPTSKGYTPTVFAELPRLLERAGPGAPGGGAITGLFTVLVDGGDHDEPVADAVRGILDGHVVMPRSIAERGRYPAIDVLKSVSRTLPRAHSDEENRLLREARQVLSTWADMEELVRLGAYQAGSSAEVDRAIALAPKIEDLLRQGKHERGDPGEAFARLAEILG